MNQKKFEINSTCIACDICPTMTTNFILSETQTQAIIKTQPNTEKEYQICLSALKKCPVNAIKQTHEHIIC